MRGRVLFCRAVPFLVSLAFTIGAHAAPREDMAEASFITKPTKLWTEPTKFGEATAILEVGVKFDVLDYSTRHDWVEVRTPSGREGWIPVRFTALANRRTQNPLVPMGGAEKRNPASVDEDIADVVEDKPLENSPASKDKKHAKTARLVAPSERVWQMTGEFAQQVSPEGIAGVAMRPGVFWQFSDAFWFGAGLDFTYGFKSTSGSGVGGSFQVDKTIMRFFPNGAVRYRRKAFRIDAAVGVDLQRTGLTTTDLSSGAIVYTDSTGLQTSGNGWNTALGLRISPAYMFPLEPNMELGAVLTYDAVLDLSSGSGTFLGTPSSGLYNTFGVGLVFSMGF